MRALIEKYVTRNTTEQKTAQADIIYYEHIIKIVKFLGITINKITTTYNCAEKEDSKQGGVGFKNNKK